MWRRYGSLAADPLAKLVALLASDDAAVRWWGAVGLTARSRQAAPAAEALSKALNDPSPEVRIAAAEALGNLGRHPQALPVLLDGLKHTSPVVRLRALNAIDRLGLRAMPVLEAIQAARTEAPGPVAEYVNRMVDYLPGRPQEN